MTARNRPRLKTLGARFDKQTLSKLTPTEDRAEIRGTAAARGYDREWAKASRDYRAEHAHCAYCALRGVTRASELVDHLYPHGIKHGVATPAQRALFNARINWVACCQVCHRSFKRRLEAEGIAAIDALADRLGRVALTDEALRDAAKDALARAYGAGGGGR